MAAATPCLMLSQPRVCPTPLVSARLVPSSSRPRCNAARCLLTAPPHNSHALTAPPPPLRAHGGEMVPLAWQHRLGLAATSRPQTPAVNTILGWHHHPCSCLTDCTGANRMHITWRRRRRPTLTNAAATIVGWQPDTPMCTAVPLAWWHTSCPPKSQRHLNGLAVQRCSPLSCSRLQQSPSIGSARTATCAKTLCL